MEVSGKVVDQATGLPVKNATIWEFDPNGTEAWVLGYSLNDGSYKVQVENADSNLNFVADGYIGTNIPAMQAAGSDQTLLQRDNTITAKLTLSNIPAWVWVLLAAFGIYYIGDEKKK
jgi:hypothetical protein